MQSSVQDRISPEYLKIQQETHRLKSSYGTVGGTYAPIVLSLLNMYGLTNMLDYGCGKRTLEAEIQSKLPGFDVRNYDPAIPEVAAEPKSAQLVTCTDVMEHVEEACVPAVLHHLFELTEHSLFITVDLEPANKHLPDGRNTHITLKPSRWWFERIFDTGFIFTRGDRARGTLVLQFAKPGVAVL